MPPQKIKTISLFSKRIQRMHANGELDRTGMYAGSKVAKFVGACQCVNPNGECSPPPCNNY